MHFSKIISTISYYCKKDYETTAVMGLNLWGSNSALAFGALYRRANVREGVLVDSI